MKKENKFKKYKLISNIVFVIAIGFSLYTLITTYFIRAGLPEGVCPVDNNSELIYGSLALLIVSFIISMIVDKKVKKSKI